MFNIAWKPKELGFFYEHKNNQSLVSLVSITIKFPSLKK